MQLRRAFTSQPPPVKNRLNRPKTRESSPDGEPRRTSLSDLRSRPDARQNIRKQLSGTFLDTTRRKSSTERTRRVSYDGYGSNDIVAGREKMPATRPSLMVGGNASAKSSTSSVNRLSAMNDSQTIDVEAAITLLQELKKQASPEELVALHRALLPTREVETVTSPTVQAEGDARHPAAFLTSSSTRRASKLPPGLATRGGFEEDLLRKPDSTTPKKTKFPVEQSSSWGHRREAGSVNSLEALDLAKEKVARPETPEIRFEHVGGYAPGTLRITNGAASPEPMMMRDQMMKDMTAGHGSLDFHPGHRAHEDLPLRERTLQSACDRANQEIAPLSIRRSTAAAQSSTVPLQISTHVSDSDYPCGSASPMTPRHDAPVRVQRSRERASVEYASDGEVSEGPREMRTFINFASRLSTVYGEDQEADDEDGTPADALAKLAGETPTHAYYSAHINAPRNKGDDRPPVAHVDSGYGSDGSDRARRMAERERLLAERSTGETPSPPPQVDMTRTTTFAMSSVSENDNGDTKSLKSLYTLKEFMASPSARKNEAPPLPSPKGRPLLYALRGRSSLKPNSAPTTPTMSQSPEPTSSPTVTDGKSKRLNKSTKKLQKPLPPRFQSKEAAARKEGVKESVAKASLEAANAKFNAGDIPAPSASITRSWTERLSQTPTMAGLYEGQSCSVSSQKDEYVPVSRASLDNTGLQIKPRGALRTRSLSRGRNDGSISLTPHESPKEVKVSSGIFRFRSRSRSNSANRTAVHDVSQTAVVESTDFNAVAATLGSSPYDMSTNQFRKLHSAGGKSGPPSPWRISTGLSMSKSVTGMDEEAASELARAKSRDVAGLDLFPNHDWPRMATPRWQSTLQVQSSTKTKAGKSKKSTKSLRSVEDSFPEWLSKQAMPGMPQTQHKQAAPSVESIPPLPEMPTDIGKRAAKADEMMARRTAPLGDSVGDSVRASMDVRNHVSVATTTVTTTKGRKSRKVQEMELQEEELANARQLMTLTPAVRPKSTDADIQIEVREMAGSNSEQSSVRHSRASSVEESVVPRSPTHDATHPGWPGWESQTKLWRQHRESVTAASNVQVSVATPDHLSSVRASGSGFSTSPSIVVSRYITPLGNDNATRANVGPDPTSTAAQHADSYRNLIDEPTEDKENRLVQVGKTETSRIDSACGDTTTSTSTWTTVSRSNVNEEVRLQPTTRDPRPAKQDVQRFDSAFSAKSYTSTTTMTSSRGGTRAQTFTAYNPRHHPASNAFTLSRLNGANGLLALSSTSSTESLQHGSGIVVDRYSGGLQYEWERGAGFGGSTGTRYSGSNSPGAYGRERKGVQLAESFGVDLGDVPVFLQRYQ